MGENILLDGIAREAAEEAEKILSQAKIQADVRKAGLKNQLEQISREFREETGIRLSEIKKRTDSTVKTARRRASLKYREQVFQRVLARAEEQLVSRMNTREYPEILSKWIAEGMVGLSQNEALVSVSHHEVLTDEILKRSAELVKSATGRDVKFYQGEPLSSQGVSVTSMDGRTSFNNQITTRFRRYSQEIKKIVYNALENKE